MRFLLPLTLILACSRTKENTRIDEDPVNSLPIPTSHQESHLLNSLTMMGMDTLKMMIVMTPMQVSFQAEDRFGDDIDQNCDGVDGLSPLTVGTLNWKIAMGMCTARMVG